MQYKFWKQLTLFMILALLVLALSACASGETEQAAPAEEPAAEVEEPAAEVEEPVVEVEEPAADTQIIIGTLGEAQTLNPILTNEAEGIWRTTMMFDPLIELHPNTFEPTGRLATKWEISEDGLTYTFYLRDDATWHDGQPVTSADVAFTVNQILSPDYTGPDFSGWSGLVGAEAVHNGEATTAEGVKIIDDHTVSFTLEEINAPFLIDTLGFKPFIPIPKHILEGQDMATADFNVAPIGNGPYKFTSWEVGDTFVMEANLEWWGETPQINRIIHRNIPDSQTLVIALEAGEIDSSLYALPTVADQLRAKDNLKVIVVPFDIPNGFKYNLEHPVLSDLAVRQAIAHAVDTELFADEFLLGLGKPGLGPVAPGAWLNESLEQHVYDPDLAKSILEEAGWIDADGDNIREKDGVVAEITAETNAGNVMREDFCTYTQASLLDIGITWHCEFKEWSVIVDDAGTGNFDAIQPQWAGSSVEPHELYTAFHSEGSNNLGHYNNPQVDDLLELGRVTVDAAERKIIYNQIQEIIMQELPVSYSWYRPFIHVIDKKFDGPWLQESKLGGGIYRNIYEWEFNE